MAKPKAQLFKLPDAKAFAASLQAGFSTYGGAEKAKRLRTNAARAATTAREIRAMATDKDGSLAAELQFLDIAAQFFDELNSQFERQQALSTKAKAKAEAEWLAKREASIAATIADLFGSNPQPAQVATMAEALMKFADNANAQQQARALRVDRWFFFINRHFELRTALKNGDTPKIAREIAEVRLEVGERGRYWNDGDARHYSAGWADFETFLRH